ncbi:MAG: YidB family protein [Moraxellaceae bacterium]|nr:YidB family protein [Moraxellaceae bacterium]
MGLLDGIGSMLGGAQAGGSGGDIMAVAQQLLGQAGGLEGLLKKFQENGLGEVAASWVGKGQNLPISAEQIQKVLGNEQMAAIASKLGVDPQQASTQLAQMLPGLVDKLTPDGQVAQGGDLLAQGANLLKGFMRS